MKKAAILPPIIIMLRTIITIINPVLLPLLLILSPLSLSSSEDSPFELNKGDNIVN